MKSLRNRRVELAVEGQDVVVYELNQRDRIRKHRGRFPASDVLFLAMGALEPTPEMEKEFAARMAKLLEGGPDDVA